MSGRPARAAILTYRVDGDSGRRATVKRVMFRWWHLVVAQTVWWHWVVALKAPQVRWWHKLLLPQMVVSHYLLIGWVATILGGPLSCRGSHPGICLLGEGGSVPNSLTIK